LTDLFKSEGAAEALDFGQVPTEPMRASDHWCDLATMTWVNPSVDSPKAGMGRPLCDK